MGRVRYDVRVLKSSRNSGRASVSIEDVASAASVSIATVSRVLNNPGLVSATTSARVQDAIKKLGYVPNPFAKGLITRASRVLGIALPDIHGEFYSELLRGADGAARQRGYHLLVSSEHSAKDGEVGAGRNLAFGLVDGLAVMITEPNDRLWREARELELPVVIMDLEVNEPGVDCVLIDNASGTREAVEHLLDGTPADKLYFVGGPRHNFDSQKRADVFASVLRQARHEPKREQISFGEYSVKWGYDWGRQAFGSSSAGGGGLRWIGVMAGNDEIAMGVMHAAVESGLNVPGDVRVVGFDGTRLSSLVRPGLSTVRVPMDDAGAAGISLLIKRVEEPDRVRETMRLPTKLVVRESSRKKS
jgi:LacI family transcriptional regulator